MHAELTTSWALARARLKLASDSPKSKIIEDNDTSAPVADLLACYSAGVGGDAQPGIVLIQPSIREPTPVIERFAFVSSFSVILPEDESHIPVANHLHLIVGHQRGMVGRIFIIGQELPLVHHRAIIVSVDVAVRYQAFKRRRIMTHLRPVPGVLWRKKLGLVRVDVSRVGETEYHGSEDHLYPNKDAKARFHLGSPHANTTKASRRVQAKLRY